MNHITFGTMLAASVPAVRRAQDRAMDVFMALSTTTPASEMERFFRAIEHIEINTDIAAMTRLTEEMQAYLPEVIKEKRETEELLEAIELLLANIPQYEL